MSTLQRSVRQLLRRLDAPRVLTAPALAALAEEARPGSARSAVIAMAAAFEADGDLRRVHRGIYLNRCLQEPASVAEAAPYLRRGAIVSLHTVLGDAGVLNNYTHDIWCVVPFSRADSPSQRPVELEDGTRFLFRGIPESKLFAAGPVDYLAPVSYPRATNEAALCHWLYLSTSRHSDLGKLPGDLDLDGVDMERVERVAESMGIGEVYRDWARDAEVDFEQAVAPGLGF
jgi:hypothetical protein